MDLSLFKSYVKECIKIIKILDKNWNDNMTLNNDYLMNLDLLLFEIDNIIDRTQNLTYVTSHIYTSVSQRNIDIIQYINSCFKLNNTINISDIEMKGYKNKFLENWKNICDNLKNYIL